ncbi:hypothetical protein U9M48_001606 [Paspalum notatum var. saurae]|uniref:Uncharacterized protein n=1 Tax=Paspalum notatum var. saurae TaxID=547442 RepID=A0AAQ3PP47_PASNO
MPSAAASAVGSSGPGDREVLATTSAIVAEAVTGSHVLEIKVYSLIKGLGNGKFIKSSSFSVGGHRRCIRSDNADWISIFLQLDHANDAAEVKARFKAVSLQIVQDIDTFCAKDPSWGFAKFAQPKALERLRLICEEKLCDSIDTGTVATTLVLAEQHGCHGLKKACFKFLEKPSHLETAMATEGFDHLISSCPCLVKELLAKAYACP